jgi:hypothetical protein
VLGIGSPVCQFGETLIVPRDSENFPEPNTLRTDVYRNVTIQTKNRHTRRKTKRVKNRD